MVSVVVPTFNRALARGVMSHLMSAEASRVRHSYMDVDRSRCFFSDDD
jgi:hypothetical protein